MQSAAAEAGAASSSSSSSSTSSIDSGHLTAPLWLVDGQKKHDQLRSEVWYTCILWIAVLFTFMVCYASCMTVYVLYAHDLGNKNEIIISLTIFIYFIISAISDAFLLFRTEESGIKESSSWNIFGYHMALNESVFICQFLIMTLGILIQALSINFTMLALGLQLIGIGFCTPEMFKTFLIRMMPLSDAILLTNAQSMSFLFALVLGNLISAVITVIVYRRAVYYFCACYAGLTCLLALKYLLGSEYKLTNKMQEMSHLYHRIHHYRHSNNANQNSEVIEKILEKFNMCDAHYEFPLARRLVGLKTAEEESLSIRFSVDNSVSRILHKQGSTVVYDFDAKSNKSNESASLSSEITTTIDATIINEDESMPEDEDDEEESAPLRISLFSLFWSWEFTPTSLAVFYLALMASVEAMISVWFNPYIVDRYNRSVLFSNTVIAVTLLSTALFVGIATRYVIPALTGFDSFDPVAGFTNIDGNSDNRILSDNNDKEKKKDDDETSPLKRVESKNDTNLFVLPGLPESRSVLSVIHGGTVDLISYGLDLGFGKLAGPSAIICGLTCIIIGPDIEIALLFFVLALLIGLPMGFTLALCEGENVRGNLPSMTNQIGAVRVCVIQFCRALGSTIVGLLWDVHTPSVIEGKHSKQHLWMLYLVGSVFIVFGTIQIVYWAVFRQIREKKLFRNQYVEMTQTVDS